MTEPSILITGAAGLIGTATRTVLDQAGVRVRSLDKLPRDLDGRAIDIVADIVEDDGWEGEFSDVSGVVHLAALSRVIDAEKDPVSCTRTNLYGTRRVIDAADAANGCGWLIFGSSREVYGQATCFPVAEDHPLKPMNHYGCVKVEGEHMVEQECSTRGMRQAILRFSNVYGHPGDHPTRVVNAFIRHAIRREPLQVHGGSQVFDFTYIGDVARAIVATVRRLGADSSSPPPVHVVTGRPIALRYLVDVVRKSTGVEVGIEVTAARNYDVDKFWGDPTRLREQLGITCEIGLEEGILRTVKAFRAALGEYASESQGVDGVNGEKPMCPIA